jgi:outer membrane biosynthesis protein TonB
MPHADILDERESLGRPFVGSIVLHAGVLGVLFVTAYTAEKSKVRWGVENPGGGPASVSVNPVHSIPLPQRSGRVNPLANDTESQLPQIPKNEPQVKEKAPDPDAIPLKSRTKHRVAPEAAVQNRYHPEPITRPSQVYSHDAPALKSDMFDKAGSGQIGVGPNGPLGTQCGAYASQIQQLVASKWHTSEIDGRLNSAPPVIFTFNLHRDGSFDGLRQKESSGNYQIDTSAQRALAEITQFPPITCGSNGGLIEFWFQLKR